jgi:hypothetical protein
MKPPDTRFLCPPGYGIDDAADHRTIEDAVSTAIGQHGRSGGRPL